MGRVDVPNYNQQPEPPVHQLNPFVEVSETQHQQQQPAGIYIQPHIYVQPQVSYVQPPPVSQFHTQDFQPPSAPPVVCPPPQRPQGWTTGLFDCMDDPENAIITLCCPCVTFGQIATIVDSGRTSCETAGCIYTTIALCIAFPCIYSFTYRAKLRARFGLEETPASDCITHLFCEYCALCQEYRELNHRDLNPSAGWMNQNMNPRQQRMVPPAYQTMR